MVTIRVQEEQAQPMEEMDAKISSKARSTSSKIKLLSNSRLLGNKLSITSVLKLLHRLIREIGRTIHIYPI
jgi:hypothetical protein